MAFNPLPCDDIMAQIGKHTIDQRRAFDRQYWVDMVRDPIRHLDNRTHTFVADLVADFEDFNYPEVSVDIPFHEYLWGSGSEVERLGLSWLDFDYYLTDITLDIHRE